MIRDVVEEAVLAGELGIDFIGILEQVRSTTKLIDRLHQRRRKLAKS